MIAHTGLPVSDYAVSKKFYKKALAPLGYTNNMDYGDAGGVNDGNSQTSLDPSRRRLAAVQLTRFP